MKSDGELISEYTQKRSEAAFRQLVERYGGTVYSICRRRLRDAHLAEDAAQLVFSTLAAKSARLEPGPIGPWLFQTAHFVANNLASERARRGRRELRAAEERPDFVEPADASEMVELVEKKLTELSTTYRDALVLRYIEGRSLPEIATELQISQEATKKRLVRGLDELRNMLSDAVPMVSVAVAKAALRGIGGGPIPPGMADRIMAKLGGQGHFARTSGQSPNNPRARMATGAAMVVTVGIVGMVTIWWVNSNRIPAVSLTKSVIPSSPPTAEPPIPVRQRLAMPVPDFESNASLEGAIEMLSKRAKVPIDVRWPALAKIGIEPKDYAPLRVMDITLSDALEKLVNSVPGRAGELGYSVLADRIVISVAGESVAGN